MRTLALGHTDLIPTVVEYKISDVGHLRYYLAPKIADDDETEQVEE